MIRVWINGQQRDGVDEGWINRTVNGLRRDGEDVCVRVTVQTDEIDLAVQAGVCPAGGAGSRVPNAREQSVLASWAECGLGDEFAPGRLTQCLKRLERLV
jgi:hypothetical protein